MDDLVLSRYLPQKPLEKIRRYLRCQKEQVLMRLMTHGRASLHQLDGFRDSGRGKRCFIIGNGPSLRQTNLDLLRNEITFGLNRIYLIFPEIHFNTTYLVSVNRLVLEQCAQEILNIPCYKFIPWSARFYLNTEPTADTIFIDTACGKPGFQTDMRHPLWAGATVTYVALQLAYWMGFEQVILVGVDHSFTTQGQAHTEVTSTGEDPNHFSPGYFGKGFRWNLPDLETSEIAYRMAREAYEKAGRQVVDVTIGGKLTVFPKADYPSLFV